MKYIYFRSSPVLALGKGNDQQIINQATLDLNGELESQGYVSGDVIMFTLVLEKVGEKEVLDRVMEFCENYAKSVNANCYFILHDTAKQFSLTKRNVYYIDTWAWVTYKHTIKHHRKRWNSDNNKALFLVGKALRPQRIGLLNEFYKNNLLEYLDFTLHLPYTNANVTTIQQMGIEGLSDEKYIIELLHELQRPSIDIDLQNQIQHTGFEYTGFPTKLRYYKNTCLSVVSENSFETRLDNHETLHSIPYLTEKVFRAMVNNHPFIILGDSGSEEYLERCGYKTFNKFFLPLTNKVKSLSNERIKWTANSVKHFMDIKDSHLDEINSIVTHNYNLFKTKIENEMALFCSTFPKINMNHISFLGSL